MPFILFILLAFVISGGCWVALAISWFPWDGILWSVIVGTRKLRGGMALEGMQQKEKRKRKKNTHQKTNPTPASFLQLRTKPLKIMERDSSASNKDNLKG